MFLFKFYIFICVFLYDKVLFSVCFMNGLCLAELGLFEIVLDMGYRSRNLLWAVLLFVWNRVLDLVLRFCVVFCVFLI